MVIPYKRVVLFLDLDGVLHSTEAEIIGIGGAAEELRLQMVHGQLNPNELGLLCQDKQALLADLLLKHPQVDIAISSAWRGWESAYAGDPADLGGLTFELRHVQTLDWLKRWMLPVISSRIIGKTCFEGTRLQQIRQFIDSLDSRYFARRWIAVDDQQAHFPADRMAAFYRENAGGPYHHDPQMTEFVVLVDGRTGLTAESVTALDAALRLATVEHLQQPVQACRA